MKTIKSIRYLIKKIKGRGSREKQNNAKDGDDMEFNMLRDDILETVRDKEAKQESIQKTGSSSKRNSPTTPYLLRESIAHQKLPGLTGKETPI